MVATQHGSGAKKRGSTKARGSRPGQRRDKGIAGRGQIARGFETEIRHGGVQCESGTVLVLVCRKKNPRSRGPRWLVLVVAPELKVDKARMIHRQNTARQNDLVAKKHAQGSAIEAGRQKCRNKRSSDSPSRRQRITINNSPVKPRGYRQTVRGELTAQKPNSRHQGRARLVGSSKRQETKPEKQEYTDSRFLRVSRSSGESLKSLGRQGCREASLEGKGPGRRT